jgi:hypothetical protein
MNVPPVGKGCTIPITSITASVKSYVLNVIGGIMQGTLKFTDLFLVFKKNEIQYQLAILSLDTII